MHLYCYYYIVYFWHIILFPAVPTFLLALPKWSYYLLFPIRTLTILLMIILNSLSIYFSVCVNIWLGPFCAVFVFLTFDLIFIFLLLLKNNALHKAVETEVLNVQIDIYQANCSAIIWYLLWFWGIGGDFSLQPPDFCLPTVWGLPFGIFQISLPCLTVIASKKGEPFPHSQIV